MTYGRNIIQGTCYNIYYYEAWSTCAQTKSFEVEKHNAALFVTPVTYVTLLLLGSPDLLA